MEATDLQVMMTGAVIGVLVGGAAFVWLEDKQGRRRLQESQGVAPAPEAEKSEKS
ncbi:MAG: hypothetical protein SF053_12150 [Bacteroidia bacterium]|jgi:gas vesicle protein|nr:hypothetical protein [Bacteroidia bacterium]